MYIYPFVRMGNRKPSAYPRPSSETGRVRTKQIIEKENETRSLFTPTSAPKSYKPTTFRWSLPNRLPADLFSTVQQVLSEVQEARRLKQQVDSLLHPNERQWIDTTIAETDTTANEIAVLLEPRRVAREIGQGGKIGLRNRLRWALRDSHRAKEKTAQLVLSRNSLMVVLGNLHMRGSALSPTSKPSTPKPPSITTITSPAELDSLSIFGASRREGCEVKVKRDSPLSDELSEILAWRRTKGAWICCGGFYFFFSLLFFDAFYDAFPLPTDRNEDRKCSNANKTETGTSRPNSYDRGIWKPKCMKNSSRWKQMPSFIV
ncbi:hypothetical protein EMPG_14496 [Blastomyces silverae]|uniref:Uncharacterized protein n=1 Tax=Blastomyces silverae TaxID=2060906 RepID=A0A0H1BLR8_9EURO|nr:hypothetical protein EMPG_14496 [Blastomyces silverae]